MAALSAVVFTLSGWLGLYLLARNPRKSVLAYVVGVRAYAQHATAAGLDPTARQAWEWLGV